jgi:methylmalonyl-CoA/ethylmalonyl-CoA epimerase
MIDGAIDHVAVAVHDIRSAMPLFVDSLGGEFLYGGDNKHQGFRWAQFRFPRGGKIELVTPLTPDGFVARFLERRGEGVHHVTLKVPDIHRAMAHLTDRGVPLINVWTDEPDWKEAFIHPKDAHGVLIQIAQSSWSDEEVVSHHLEPHGPEGHRHLTLADILAGGAGDPPA